MTDPLNPTGTGEKNTAGWSNPARRHESVNLPQWKSLGCNMTESVRDEAKCKKLEGEKVIENNETEDTRAIKEKAKSLTGSCLRAAEWKETMAIWQTRQLGLKWGMREAGQRRVCYSVMLPIDGDITWVHYDILLDIWWQGCNFNLWSMSSLNLKKYKPYLRDFYCNRWEFWLKQYHHLHSIWILISMYC